ncbi:GIY-YIG nuclease family protein [Naasia sp. SYSU D00948]|uniref:GIY-YIG nuclease family protein n=1 Tax=Naasia sp. SYSU D00948 TaxID=2817379 RepID=UPI001B30736C|nr:GIY-YIG nuclease family protein [Naasia sp. SYSU D00948]
MPSSSEPAIPAGRAGRSCVADSCGRTVPADGPLGLCDVHLAIAAAWVEETDGRTDLLPSPCRLCGSRLGVRYPSGWLCAICEWRVGDTVDEELPPPRVDVVYYLRYEDRVKIGTSANPRQRLSRIRHQELLAFERGGRSIEQRRHAQFAEDRYTPASEWFRLSPVILRHLEVLGAGAQDPWELHARWVSEALALRG